MQIMRCVIRNCDPMRGPVGNAEYNVDTYVFKQNQVFGVFSAGDALHELVLIRVNNKFNPIPNA